MYGTRRRSNCFENRSFLLRYIKAFDSLPGRQPPIFYARHVVPGTVSIAREMVHSWGLMVAFAPSQLLWQGPPDICRAVSAWGC